MKYTKITLGLLLSIVMIFSSACKKELDVAPYATFDGKATHTIAELLQFHPLTEGFTYDTIPQGIIIQGIVISSDKEGNCYKYITIDDGTAGVQIKINSSSLYTNYPLGQRVFVKCDGLVLGDYGMLHQLGWWENGSMQGLNTNRINKYIFRDGLPGATPAPIELNSANEIQDNMYNRLVKIKNCHFKYPGSVFAETTSSGTSNEIVFTDGSEIVLYTSAYAKFASQLTPEGKFDMIAILSRFRTTKQLVLRSLDDLHVEPVVQEKTIYNMNLSQNPLLNGWSNITTAGSSWEYVTAGAMSIQGVNGNNDSWLISPVVNAASYDNVILSNVDNHYDFLDMFADDLDLQKGVAKFSFMYVPESRYRWEDIDGKELDWKDKGQLYEPVFLVCKEDSSGVHMITWTNDPQIKEAT